MVIIQCEHVVAELQHQRFVVMLAILNSLDFAIVGQLDEQRGAVGEDQVTRRHFRRFLKPKRSQKKLLSPLGSRNREHKDLTLPKGLECPYTP